jgi:branched-chain amino acid aminotransferase
MQIYLGDRLVPAAEAKVSVLDHGLLYGDGIFEGIRIYDGCIFRLRQHLERLRRSAKAILLPLPWSLDALAEATAATCRANNLTSGYIRLVVTRGEGSLGISPDSCRQPQLIIIADQIKVHDPATYTQGIKVITSAQRQLPPDVFPAQVKSLNYVKNVVAKIEAQRLGYPDAIILNSAGYVVEAIVENIFALRDGQLMTPPASLGALEGVTRQAVIDLAGQLGIPCREALFTRFDLWQSDEVFLTGTGAELVPVVEIDGRTIGEGKPGSTFARLHAAFADLVKKDGVRI